MDRLQRRLPPVAPISSSQWNQISFCVLMHIQVDSNPFRWMFSGRVRRPSGGRFQQLVSIDPTNSFRKIQTSRLNIYSWPPRGWRPRPKIDTDQEATNK